MDKSREQFEAWLESEDGKALMAYSDNHTIAEAAWEASRAALCPKCGGTGMADSGGVQPWGEPIEIPCDCPFGDNK